MLKKWYVIAGITLGGLAACVLLLVAGGVAGYAAAQREWVIGLPGPWQDFGPQRPLREDAPGLRPQVPQPWQTPPELMPQPFSGRLGGTLIVEVESGGPADQGGIETGDIVIAVNNRALDEDQNLSEVVLSHEPGDDIMLTIVRPGDDKEVMELEVTLGSDTNDEGEVVPHLGVRYRPVFSGTGLAPLERGPRFDRGTQLD
jgi:hypothetical protein